MNFRDFMRPPQKIITIRYRDKYVDLTSDTDRYGMMTQNLDGSIEFDFSECRVVGVRDVWPVPVVVDENAPPGGALITREQLQEAAKQIAASGPEMAKKANGDSEVLQ